MVRRASSCWRRVWRYADLSCAEVELRVSDPLLAMALALKYVVSM